jgi:hypothetical protein
MPETRITDSREHQRESLVDQRRPVPGDGSSARASPRGVAGRCGPVACMPGRSGTRADRPHGRDLRPSVRGSPGEMLKVSRVSMPCLARLGVAWPGTDAVKHPGRKARVMPTYRARLVALRASWIAASRSSRPGAAARARCSRRPARRTGVASTLPASRGPGVGDPPAAGRRAGPRGERGQPAPLRAGALRGRGAGRPGADATAAEPAERRPHCSAASSIAAGGTAITARSTCSGRSAADARQGSAPICLACGLTAYRVEGPSRGALAAPEAR